MTKILTVTSIMIMSFFVKAQSSNNGHKMYLEAGLTGGTYSNSGANFGVFGAGGFFFNSGKKQSAIDIRAKELYITNPQRESGAITFSYRLYPSGGFYLGAGFAHSHEVNFDDFLEDPVRSVLGNGDAIIHRSGLMAEVGYDFKSVFEKFGLYPTTNISFTYLTLDDEPNPLINLTLGARFGFKPLN